MHLRQKVAPEIYLVNLHVCRSLDKRLGRYCALDYVGNSDPADSYD